MFRDDSLLTDFPPCFLAARRDQDLWAEHHMLDRYTRRYLVRLFVAGGGVTSNAREVALGILFSRAFEEAVQCVARCSRRLLISASQGFPPWKAGTKDGRRRAA